MRNPLIFTTVLTLLILAIDFYAYRGVKKLTHDKKIKTRRTIFYIYWSIPVVLIISLIIFAYNGNRLDPATYMPYFHTISGSFLLFYLPKLIFVVFNIFDDIIFAGRKTLTRIKFNDSKNKATQITRRKFLTRTGLIVSAIPFLSIAYGIKWGRWDYSFTRNSIVFDNLPKSFDGLKIVQLSDFHIGSFLSHREKVEEIVDLVNDEEPDLIFFTGDLVNNVAEELNPFVPALKKLKSKYGMFSVLGNHDYGEYVPWNSAEAKSANLEELKALKNEIGFDIILNDSRKVEKDGEFIDIVGVENWGTPPFPQYGKLDEALKNTHPGEFKILLSHDPTHFDKQVLNKTDIDLTLSGHTHGAQFGIQIPGWKWSPVSLRYTHWGGLYKEGKQYINVNTGIGFIGYPGRIGMPPEISVIELRNS